MTRLHAPLLSMMVALGCTPELEPIRWSALDVEALREAIANPTGIVDEASTNEVAAEIVTSDAARRSLTAFIHAVFIGAADAEAEPVWVVPRALGGTSVYVLIACPGPALLHEASFEHGFMRVDSPSLTADVLSTFEIRGQLLLSFEGCRIAEHVFDGSARTHHDLDARELAFDPDIDFVAVADEGPAADLDEAMLWSGDEWISALFELGSGATLVLEWRLDTAALRLRGSNGALVCEVADAELSCVAP